MIDVPDSDGADGAFAQLLEPCSPHVRDLAVRARSVIRDALPGASQEVDAGARLLAFTFIPGTYRGLVVAISLQKTWVNIMFSKGVELLAIDDTGLLQGTGKLARHIKIRHAEDLDQPGVRQLIEAAAARTPR